MERRKIEIFITVGLVLIFVILLTSTVAKRKEKAPVEITQEMPAEKVQKPLVKQDVPVTAGQEWGRDPFVRAPQRIVQEGAFVLSACVWDPESPLAVINGNVVGVGQEVDGYTIIKIDKDNVTLKKGPEEITLELYK